MDSCAVGILAAGFADHTTSARRGSGRYAQPFNLELRLIGKGNNNAQQNRSIKGVEAAGKPRQEGTVAQKRIGSRAAIGPLCGGRCKHFTGFGIASEDQTVCGVRRSATSTGNPDPTNYLAGPKPSSDDDVRQCPRTLAE